MNKAQLLGAVCGLVTLAHQSEAQIISRESLHLQPAGTVVSGSFVLVDKRVPIPEGQFTLVASAVRGADYKQTGHDSARQGHELVDVYLGQIDDNKKLRAAVGATTVLARRHQGGWSDEPCKRDDTLFKRDLIPFMKKGYAKNCLLVNHGVNNLGPSATGVFAQFARWVGDQGGTTPIPLILNATITRVEVGEFLVVRYIFNPESYGCAAAHADSWTASTWHKASINKDPEKLQFANSVIDFGKAMQIHINDAFHGRQDSFPAPPRIRPCVHAAKQPQPSATKPGISPSASERLRHLQELRDQNLITPAEYEERRRSIVNSL
jgi:hypothetical protein